MDKFTAFLEKHLMPIANKLATNKHLTALKDSFVFTMPFLIVGSVVLLLVNLPIAQPELSEGVRNPMYVKWYSDFMAAYKPALVQPFYVSMGIMSIFVAFGIGYSLSTQYRLNAITGGFLSLFTFLIMAAKIDWVPVGELKDGMALFHLQEGGWMPIMDARYLDASGLFTAIIGGFIAIKIYRFMVKRGFTIKLPDSVPPAIAKSFELLLPVVVVILLFQPLSILVQNKLGMMIPELIMNIFRPLIRASDTLPAVIIILLIVHLLWFCGIHGVNVVVAIINPIILSNLSENQIALQAGQALPRIFAGGFLDAFVYLGGSGATIGLAIAMALSKNAHLKSIGRLSVVPGIFNINEPIIFGAPIVMNPILFIPFICVPIINASIAWFFLKTGIVGRIVTLVPWTTPSPIGALLATNFNLMAFLLSAFLVVLSIILYLPFLKVYVDVLNKQEAAEVANSAVEA